jgi:hypothetical protein
MCDHVDVVCVSHYELIRKYECRACDEVMMCACDQEFGEEFLPHQLARGRRLETRLDVPVTLGFQVGVCRECRGLAPEPHPKAELYGRTSKVVRYYWREIFFETTRRFASWAQDADLDSSKARFERRGKYDEIEKQVIDEIKKVHRKAPKYDYAEPSSAEILDRHQVEIVDLRARYVQDENGTRRLVAPFGSFDSPESAALAYWQEHGLIATECESCPFHVLFGVFMWAVIQDPGDELVRLTGFGSRSAFEAHAPPERIMTFLPQDFGAPGYSSRRAEALAEHFALLDDDLSWLFEYWLEPSSELRQYLWAHRDEDVDRARLVLSVLDPNDIRTILRYLVGSYWKRYIGWPDLLVYDSEAFFLCEVKGSGDSLRLDQKRWVADNAEILHLPFRLLKIHRAHDSG